VLPLPLMACKIYTLISDIKNIMNHYYTFTFLCEGKNSDGIFTVLEQQYIHRTELEARRELIHTLIHLHRFQPRKLIRTSVEEWFPSLFSLD
jgi:hypothetical protein